MPLRKIEPIKKLRQLCMKYDPNGRPSFERWQKGAMRYFFPVQIYITKVLLTLGFTSLSTTILWCIVGVMASGLLCFGSVPATIAGCILLYLQVALDGCDGEIARYNRRLITPEEDFRFFVRGIYLDECCHTVINPARLMGLAYGIYTQTHRVEFIFCGVAMAYLVLFRMTTSFAIPFTINKLAHKLPETMSSAENDTTKRSVKENFPERVISKVFQYYTNGKGLFMALIWLTLIDFICSVLTSGQYFILARASFILAGPFIMLAGRRLEMARKGGWHGLHAAMLDLRKRIKPVTK